MSLEKIACRAAASQINLLSQWSEWLELGEPGYPGELDRVRAGEVLVRLARRWPAGVWLAFAEGY